jgi:hypothetical protein
MPWRPSRENLVPRSAGCMPSAQLPASGGYSAQRVRTSIVAAISRIFFR